MGYRRPQITSKKQLLLISICCAALTACVQLDSDGTTDGRDPDDKSWGEAERIHVQGTNTNLAFDSDGDAVMVWRERRLSNAWEIWAHTYTRSSGWSTTVRVDASLAGDVGTPAIAVDPEGNALVVWDQPGPRYDLWASRYTPGDGWSAPELIETDDAGDTFRPRLAMDPNGNGTAVWQQFDGVRDKIWSNHYAPDDGWGIARRIDANNNATGAQAPQVAVDADGNAIAVWRQSDGTRDNIWSNRYTPGSGWGVAERIEVDNAGGAFTPHIAMDPSGNGIAVWRQHDGARDNVWSNRYTPAEGWRNAQRIETDDGGDALHPRVAMDVSGNAIAVWDQFDGLSFDVWSNHYTPDGGWGTAQRIEGNDGGEAVRPLVAVDPDGDAVVIWEQFDGTRDGIWSNRYTPGFGWGTSQRIDETTDLVRHHALAIDLEGNAIAAWNVSAGWSHPEHGIWSNRLE